MERKPPVFLAKRNEGRRSTATLTEVTHCQNEKDTQRW